MTSAQLWDKTADTKLYAHWTKNSVYAISLRLNAGNTTTVHQTAYLWYGKGWYSTSSPTDSTAALTSITTPTRAGYTYKGFSTSSTATTGTYWTSTSTMPSSTAFSSAKTLYAVWQKNAVHTVNIRLNAGDTTTNYKTVYLWYGKGWYSTSSPTDSTAALATIGTPTRAGYAYKGVATTSSATTPSVWTSPSTMPSVTYVGSATSAGTYTRYIVWEKNSVHTVTLNKNGGSGGTSTAYLWYGKGWYSTSNPGDSTAAMTSITAPERAGYAFKGYAISSTATTASYWTSASTMPSSTAFSSAKTLYAVWAKNAVHAITLDPQGGSGGTAVIYQWTGKGFYATSNPTESTAAIASITAPARPGFAYGGYYTEADGRGEQRIASTSLASLPDAAFTAPATLYANWTVVVAADVPIEVTAKVDLLGIEEPTEATGWIESRSGGALKVAEVSFAPLAGAAQLFGSRTAEVFLEAYAEGSVSADVSFALDAAAIEADASKLAPFALPDGYGTRIGVGYRFVMPDDVVSSLDASRFEGIATPVGQVVYTVALAE